MRLTGSQYQPIKDLWWGLVSVEFVYSAAGLRAAQENQPIPQPFDRKCLSQQGKTHEDQKKLKNTNFEDS
jgi:hypothetical protein